MLALDNSLFLLLVYFLQKLHLAEFSLKHRSTLSKLTAIFLKFFSRCLFASVFIYLSRLQFDQLFSLLSMNTIA